MYDSIGYYYVKSLAVKSAFDVTMQQVRPMPYALDQNEAIIIVRVHILQNVSYDITIRISMNIINIMMYLPIQLGFDS